MSPIVGVRYKCSVCKNFDFCQMCEERRNHEHAFLKIYRPDQAPKAMFTVVDEKMQNARPDIEQNVEDDQMLPNFFKNLVQGFAQHHGHCRGRGGWRGRGGFGGHGNHGDHWAQKQMWRAEKAKLVSSSFNPGEPLKLKPGEVSMITVEVKNGSNCAWNRGETLQSNYSPQVAMLLEEVIIPMDFEVNQNQTFKFTFPVTVRQSAVADEAVHTASFNFFGRKGRQFGDSITLKFQVVNEINEIELYTKACKVYESQKDNLPKLSFD